MLRLGVNIDHVATIRNARGGLHPDPLRAAVAAVAAGADGITIHLREDRRHIRDADVAAVRHGIAAPLNLEMAATAEMLRIALETRPNACCIVPEKRTEVTTEGGLDVAGQHNSLRPIVAALKAAGIRVSLFVDPDAHQLQASAEIGADIVELHTGAYAHGVAEGDKVELARLVRGAALAHGLGLEVHAGHGLTYENVGPVAAIPQVVELNIGHFLIGEAVFVGLDAAVTRMRALMDAARG
jgi:pyridoxine 5-phosphate synthase